MTKIERVRTARIRLPMTSSLRWGSRSELEELEHVLVRVDAADGCFGIAEAPVRPSIYGETPESIEAMIDRVFAPAVVGRELHDEDARKRALDAAPYNFTARGALDVAIREARERSRGRGLLEAYRGPRQGIRVSYILGIDAVDRMVAEAVRVAELGVRVFKVKVGRDHDADVAVLLELASALEGAGPTLYADANEAYDAAEAPKRLERLAELGVAWVEEPLPVHLVRERAELKRRAILPIIADDSAFTLRDLERELAFDTFDILNVKPARTGYGVGLEMLRRAEAAGKGVMIGSQAASGLGTLHAAILATHDAVTHPSELSFPLRLTQDVLEAPLRFDDGLLHADGLEEARLRASFRDDLWA